MIVTDVTELHKVSQPVAPEEFERLKEILFGFLQSIPGRDAVGISAVQLGMPQAAFAFWQKPDTDEPMLEFVANPRIRACVDPETKSLEGCLSIPGCKYIVPRYFDIDVQYEGGSSSCDGGHYVLYGRDAIVFQHEFDHTMGILISDRGISVPKDIGRNDKCPCGSNLKWKRCCGKDS